MEQLSSLFNQNSRPEDSQRYRELYPLMTSDDPTLEHQYFCHHSFIDPVQIESLKTLIRQLESGGDKVLGFLDEVSKISNDDLYTRRKVKLLFTDKEFGEFNQNGKL
jgi:hypothetical protein